ncbi:MAG: VanW family protein [Clostridia bacterium]|nr:VanW family protein [Clostridia bacterium]
MKFLMVLCAVLMLGGCNMTKDDIPLPSEMPTIDPSAIPSIIPSMTPQATESPVALGVFITEILDTTPDRVHNLKLCAENLNGKIILAGTDFSFNDTVGERTREKGYREAIMLVEGEKVEAVGGGLCQISSTLFGAAEKAGMEILERHDHTGEVHYVEIGRDAAVSFGEQDFRFKNTKSFPVRIAVSVENGQVHAALYKV